MADDPKEIPPDYDAIARNLAAEARGWRVHLQEVFGKALHQYENSLWRAGIEHGYNQGWTAGYEAAVRQLQEARATPPREARPETTGPPIEEDTEDEALTAKDVVFNIISATPGLRGVQIVAATEKAGTPLKERTVRTALHRLKTADKIKNVDERWYLRDEDPLTARKEGGA